MQPLPNKLPEVSPADVLESALPLLDVRAPAEFARGALPGARNLPILNDAERTAVGTTYRQQGRDAATAVGFDLVSGSTRNSRINAWQDYLRCHPDAAVTCWRGGQRSQIAQAWLHEAGVDVARVSGGYKALRRECLALLESAATDRYWWVVAGRTGTGKTVVIQQLDNAIDLEGAARHRGSAFGALDTPQPAQATFENQLAVTYRRLSAEHLIVEDESRTIGRIGVPLSWHTRMQKAPLVLVDATLDERIAHIEAEYVDSALATRTSDDLAASYKHALERISRRLGGELHRELDSLLEQAFAGTCSHAAWIGTLLQKYYDPMYDYQLQRKEARISFRGERSAVIEYLRTQTA